MMVDHEPVDLDRVPLIGKTGRLSGASRASAVTGDFFRKIGHADAARRALQGSGQNIALPPFALPIAALAAVFSLAVTLPTGLIAMTENTGRAAIDPIATASIGHDGGTGHLAVSDLSMTRMLKSGKAMVTVYGSIDNPSIDPATAGEVIIQLLDKDGAVLQSWHHRTGSAEVAPGRSMRFISSAADVTGRAETVVAHATRGPGRND